MKKIMSRRRIRAGVLLAVSVFLILSLVPVPRTFAADNALPALHVEGTHLVDSGGNRVQLHGVSTHGLGFGEMKGYVNEDGFRSLRDGWGVNVVRLAVYTEEYGGYTTDGGSHKAELDALIDRGVRAASDLAMYVIIDWHILGDGSPLKHQDEAVDFFRRMSEKYSGQTNVLYEICNEPNGVSWSEVKKYADTVIPVIRQNTDAVILVGTPDWSQDVDQVAANPVADPGNVMYTLHFYAATHRDNIRKKLVTAESAGTPVFISEFSICDASGGGNIDYGSAEAWKSLIDQYGLSYCSWSLSHKETSSLFAKNCSKVSGFTDADLSECGTWIMNMIRFSAASDPDSVFRDVRKSDYYYDAVKWAYENRVTNGISDSLFGPDQTCTRAQAVTFLYNCYGGSEEAPDAGFTDVSPSDYYYRAVCWAAEHGIARGTGAGRFRPDDICTRAQTVTFLYRTLSGTASSMRKTQFTDVDASAYYYEPVCWAVDRGITGGTSPETFSPDQNCTRAQMVTFLYRSTGSR